MKFSVAAVIAASAAIAVEGGAPRQRSHGPRTYDQVLEKHLRTHHQATKPKTVKDTKSTIHKRSNGSVSSESEEMLHEIIQTILDGCKVRGASVAFYDDSFMDHPIEKGYGFVSADEDAAQVTEDTVFMIASMSKVFGGVSVMKLIEDGLIASEQDDICEVLPPDRNDNQCRHPDFPDKPVTWAHIMTHTASMIYVVPNEKNGEMILEPGYGPTNGYDGSAVGNEACPLEDVRGFYRDVMAPTDPEGDEYTVIGTVGHDLNWFEIAANFVDPEIKHDDPDEAKPEGSVWLKNEEPGTFEHYSSFATGYIAALAEHALIKKDIEKSYSDYCKEKIFDPVGMSNTAWFRRDLPEGVLEAVPTLWDNDHWKDVQSDMDEKHYCMIDYAAGQLHTSAADLSSFLSAHLFDYADDVIYDNQENGEKTLTKLGGVSNYGFCWEVMTNDDKKKVAEGWKLLAKDLNWTGAGHHSGKEDGAITDMYVFPESGVYMVVLTNTSENECDATERIMNQLMHFRKENSR